MIASTFLVATLAQFFALSVQGWYIPPNLSVNESHLSSTVNSKPPAKPTVGYFLRNLENANKNSSIVLSTPLPTSLHGLTHFRLLPAAFPDNMEYHFDGLATILKFQVSSDGKTISYRAKMFEDQAATDFKKCVFYGTGFGPTLGEKVCVTNPGVNLLPLDDQLWLTIDTSKWGRVDPDTLDTITDEVGKILQPTFVNSSSFVLNAHPACDRETNVCYVQHPCPKVPLIPYSDQVCYSVLQTTNDSLNVQFVARAQMERKKLIQHSHSPCLTDRYVVSKLDAFTGRDPINKNEGLLKFLHQDEDSLWFVLDRLTNETKLISGSNKFVNNHFWNCYEDDQGMIVIETVASTENYLDIYFSRNLAKDYPDWNEIFHPPLRCHMSFNNSSISCVPLFKESLSPPPPPSPPFIFDYPTFNPYYKKKSYKYFYGISIKNITSSWFDKLIKVDVHTNEIAKEWSSPNVYLTEFDFVPTANDKKEAFQLKEDDGVLLSVLYNATNDSSMFGVFNASTIQPIGIYPMEQTVPFHAHGIICKAGKPCFTNP